MNQTTLSALAEGFASPAPIGEARQAWREVRTSVGLAATTPRLLTHPRANTKLMKGNQYGLCLIPHRLSGVNMCAYSTPECREVCINTSGRGKMPYVQQGRLARTRLLTQRPDAFATLLQREVMRLPQDSALRLNVFSDVLWEQVAPQFFATLLTERPDIQVYDYTKYPVGKRKLPSNYHLTYSASERWTDAAITNAVETGNNVTVVLHLRRSDAMPTAWRGLPVVDGDKNDARYDDPVGVVVGLRAKGKAFHSDFGFVRPA